jgi:hypothetical protein
MESYYEKLNEYYREKNKGIKCKGCKELKVFKEDKGILSFSCGGKDKCSRSFKIKLSEYINYNDTLHEYNNFLNKNSNMKKSEKDNLITNLKDILKLGEQQLIKNNNFINKKKLITKYNDLKVKTKVEQGKLLNDINDPEYSAAAAGVEKHDLVKRYHSLNSILSENYKELCELYETPKNENIMINKGKVLA